ncbi:acyl-CoA thioesterase [Parashewanella spongiae]|uniref:Acyl-CoA thioesterase n=1 Tax=Parashewanella spongiae TaxID=342950 RepID=A0A3A6UAQ6_9GAMM|nr:acyl-CoA thioesterase [Parashewanella spongiae]MCL1077504.1 acyl-CoA thioesterase [Parashewanella spongiae]RJY18639.1 acyl-CoA thioesterase [Parashewanella spongiae]
MEGNERQTTLRFLAEPADVNFGGKVHGGAVMKWIDLAAYACGAQWSGKYCITAYAGGIRFVEPIYVGNMIEVKAKVLYTGRTSMHIGIEVRAGDPKETERYLKTHCLVIMVAVDANGKSTPIPQWEPQTEEDIKLRESAIRLMEMRKKIGEEMESYVHEA